MLETVLPMLETSMVGFNDPVQIEFYETKALTPEQKERISSAITKWYPNRGTLDEYLETRYKTYQYILLAKRTEDKLVGVFFIDQYSINDELYLYAGSSFAQDFLAYVNAYFFLFQRYSNDYKTIHVLAEAQNPIILLHWHFLFSDETARSVLNHHQLTAEQLMHIEQFQKHVPHFKSFDKKSFKTTSNETLFVESKKYQMLVDFLASNNVFLDKGDSVVLFASFQHQDLPLMENKIRQGLTEGSPARQKYIKQLITLNRIQHADFQ